jgi:hypothetical protein
MVRLIVGNTISSATSGEAAVEEAIKLPRSGVAARPPISRSAPGMPVALLEIGGSAVLGW